MSARPVSITVDCCSDFEFNDPLNRQSTVIAPPVFSSTYFQNALSACAPKVLSDMKLVYTNFLFLNVSPKIGLIIPEIVPVKTNKKGIKIIIFNLLFIFSLFTVHKKVRSGLNLPII